MLTYDDAIGELNKLAGKGYGLDDLIRLVEQIVIDPFPGKKQGSVTLLYSGLINGVEGE
jgi:hypothetical protein